MRVAVVIRSLNMGGMQRSAVNLAESFAQAGHESHLIYFSEKNRVFTPAPSVKLHRFDLKKAAQLSIIGIFIDLLARLLNGIMRGSYFLWNGLFYSLLFQRRFKRLEAEYGPFDAVIIRGQGTFETLWPIKDPRFFQITVSMFIPSGTVLKNFYFKRLYQDKNVIAISSAIKKKLLSLYANTHTHPRRIDVIANPLKIDFVRQTAEAYLPEMDDPYILSVSRITPNKNISLLIEAYNLLRSRDAITQKLVIIGTGHDMENVRSKADQSPYKDSILFIGQVSNPYPWMKRADLFVLSSKLEGLGMVLLEALACGTKVVSTRSESGVMDIMKGELSRYLCEQNPESMANVIEKALCDGVELDFDTAIAPFSPDAITAQLENLFSSSQSAT